MKTLCRLILAGSLALLFGCSRYGEDRDKRALDAAFQEVFGFPPPADVKSIQTGWQRNFGIPSGAYVRFVRVISGAPTLLRIRALAKPLPARFIIFHASPGESMAKGPNWWTNATLDRNSEHFVLPGFVYTPASGRASPKVDIVFVWVDEVAGTIYAARNVHD